MFIERPHGLVRLHMLLQALVILVLMISSYVFSLAVRGYDNIDGGVHLRCAFVFWAAALLEFATRSREHSNLFALAHRRRLALSQKQFSLPVLAVLGTLVFLREPGISRAALLTFFVSYAVWVFWSNAQLPQLLAKWFFSTKRADASPVVLIANARDARRFRLRVRKGEFVGIRVVGYVDFSDTAGEDSDIRKLGALGDLDAICNEQDVAGIIVVNAHQHDEIVPALSRFCDNRSIRFMLYEDLTGRYGRRFVPHSVGNTDLLFAMPEPLENPLNQMMKRTLDICIALFALVFVLPPVALLVAAIHRRHSPGPLFFIQGRTGRGGRSFPIVKFRTMTVANPDENVQAKKHDPRIFKGGAFLRRFSFDEIPQFYNVLVGDMSVVGPRPHLPAHDDQFTSVSANYPVRRFAKPGITGLAQIKGCRGEARLPRDVRNRVRWDITYIRNWSIFLDVQIILLTVKEAVSPSERAY